MVTKVEPLFIAGGSLPAYHSSYVKRAADNDAIYAFEHEEIIYSIGPRQIGKSSLLLSIDAYLRRQGVAVCYVDLAVLKGLPPAEWFHALAEKVAEARGYAGEIPIIQEQWGFRKFLLDKIGIGRAEVAANMAILFDEIGGLLGYDFADGFLMMLRELYQARDQFPGRLLLGFAGSIDTNRLVKDRDLSPFNVAKSILLKDFTEQQCAALTGRLVHLGIPMADEVHKRIYFWTAGQPYLTQRLCSILEQKTVYKELAYVDSEAVDNIVNTAILDRTNIDKNVRHVVDAVSRLGDSAAELWDDLRRCRSVLSAHGGFLALHLTGAVIVDDHDNVRIRNRIYQRALGLACSPP